MKTTSKRVISLLLAIMMVLSIFTIVPMTASAIELTDNALLESQDGDELTYSSNKFNEVGTSGGDSRLVFSESNITIADGSGGDLTSKAYKDEVLALSKGTFLIKYTSTNTGVQSLFSVSKKDSNNTHFHIYVYNGKIGMESRNGGASGAANSFVTDAGKVTTSGTNTIAVSYSNNTYTVYANGQKIGEFTNKTSFISNLSGLDDVRVGSTCRFNNKTVGDLTYKFAGTIDLINCYNDALSDEELIHLTSGSVTVKSLYKSHKIEWTSTEISDINNFTIEDNSGNDISSKLTKLEPVTVDGTNYFTALVEVGTNASIGTIYTVKKTDDGTVIGKATVTDTTGKQALKKNAVYAYVNDSGYVINSEANKKITIATSASTGTEKVLFQKLQNLSKGSVIADFKPTTAGNNNIALIGGTDINNLWIGFTVSGGVQYYTFNNKNSFVKFGSNTSTDRREVAMCMDGTNLITAISGVAQSPLTGMDTSRLLGTTEKNYYYIGGTNDNKYTGNTSNKFTIYSLIISEEVYTSDEIKLITQNPYDIVQAVLAEAQNYVDGYAVKNDANYRKLQSEIAKYSNCSTSISEEESNTAVKALKDAISALNDRENCTVNETSINSKLLKDNAKDNNHANGSNGKDGVSAQLFDGDKTTFWHSNYANSGGTGTIGITESDPAWMQTGFGGDTKYISKIEAYTRTGSTNNQLKKYAIYVSTSKEEPNVNTSVVDSDEWTFVCGGELKAFTTEYQMHTIKFAPVEAKWVRLVAYSTSTVDKLLAMSEMKIYEVDNANVAITDNGRKLLNKLSEVEEIMTRNDVCIDSKYNTLVSLYNEYNESDLPLISTQYKIDTLVNAINDINVNSLSNKKAIDKNTLKTNAKANTYANNGSDLPATAAFDGNNNTWWHTNYGSGKGKGELKVAEGTPAWIQTGFGGAKTVTAIDLIPRSSYGCQIKKYEIYVSNEISEPDIDKTPSKETGWTLVANGTFSFLVTGDTHTVTFQPIEARWIRLVAYSAMTNATTLTDFATIGEMNVYEATSYTHKAEVINNNLTDKLSQAQKLTLRADIDANALNTAIESLGAIDLTKLTEEELQAKLDKITGAVSTTPATRTLNKSDEQSFGSDSVKWNNSAERLATLANNARANIEEDDRSVKSIFDGKYEIKQLHWKATDGTGTTYYGSWKEGSTIEPWIQTGFGERVCVDGIVVFDAYHDVNLTGNTKADPTLSLNCFTGYEVWVSNDANFNTYVVAAQGKRTGDALKYSETGYAIKFDKVYNCEYIRLVTNGSNDVKIQEIDIYEYVGQKQNLEVAIDTNACTVANDKLLNTVDFNFNKMFTDGFTKAEIEKQVLDIELSDISHNYEIVVGDDAQVSIVATDATYNLTVSANGTTTDNAQTKKYGENFDYTVENAKGWQVDGKVIANGNTFNFMATDDVTVTAITDTVSTEVSVYIPEPVVGFDGTKTTVQIPVYINGVGTETDVKKGIVLVKPDVTDEEAIKADIKSAIDGTPTTNVKISEANGATLSNKGRYIHTIKANGKLTTGTFYAYVIVNDEVKLSNAQVIGG